MPGGTVAPVTGNPFKTGLFPRMYRELIVDADVARDRHNLHLRPFSPLFLSLTTFSLGLHPRHVAVLPVGLRLRPPRCAEQALP